MKDSNYMKDVLPHICMAHLIVIYELPEEFHLCNTYYQNY